MRLRFFLPLLMLAASGLPWAVRASNLYQSPVAVAADPITRHLFIALKTGRQILEYDADLDSVLQTGLRTFPFPDDVSGVTLSTDRRLLFVTTSGAQGSLFVLDRSSGQFVTSIPVGHYPSAPLASALAPEVFVCQQFANRISVVSLTNQSVIATMPTRYQPFCMALTPDSTRLLVGHLLPGKPSNGATVFPHVSLYDTTTRQLLREFPLPDGSSGVRGICISPDGRYAYVTHLIGRYRLPTTHIERGWIWTNGLTIIDLLNNAVVNTVLLDDVDKGAANPWPVSCTEDGGWLCVATAGSEELMVIDRAALHQRLALVASGQPYEPGGYVDSASEVPNDLGFMTGLRQRIPLNGKGARSMALIGRRAFVMEYFSDLIDVVPSIGPVTQAAYGVALSEQGLLDPLQFNDQFLPAAAAQLPPSGILLEAGGNLGSWTTTNASPRWTFEAVKDGNYMIFLTASASNGLGGTYQIVVDGVAFPERTVVTTGSSTVYQKNLAAQGVILTEGTHWVEIRPLRMNGGTFMNLLKLTVTGSEMDLERVGEMLFNDATVCYQSWLSCASCHPDTRADGLNWDLGNDGLGGSPRNVKSLLHTHATPPTTMTGVRPNAYTSVRAGYKVIEFSVVPETYNVATDEYLISMKPIPSPYLQAGGLSAAGRRGEALFNTRCLSCHGGPYFTSSANTGLMWDVGTGGLMDVPTLIESWRTAPYLDAGTTLTMRDAIAALSVSSGLTGQNLDDLAEYVLSLGPMSDASSKYVAWQWVQNAAAVLPDDADVDQDGIPQLLEYFHGTSVRQPDPMPLQHLVRKPDALHWQYPGRHATDVEAILQYSEDMIEWRSLQTLPATTNELFDIPVPDDGAQRFFRVKLSRQ